MTSLVGFASGILVALVRMYQWTLRPFIGAQCRFAPSCSEYAVAALRTHGPLRGAFLAARRILRCNPWHAGGWDPVPAGPEAPCRACNHAARHPSGTHHPDGAAHTRPAG